MPASTRKKIGVALMALSLIGTTALHFSGVEFVRFMESRVTDSSAMMISFNVHWAGLPLGVMALIGFLLTVVPDRKPPKLAALAPAAK